MVRVQSGGCQHDAGSQEAGLAVDVAVGLIVLDAAVQPDHVRDVEVVDQVLLDFRLGEIRVAVLVQLTVLGDQHRSRSVHVDAAALRYQITGKTLVALLLEDCAREQGVLFVRVLVAVAIEGPGDPRAAPRSVDQKGGPGIPQPAIVEIGDAQLDRRPAAPLGVLEIFLFDEHVNGFEAGDGAGDFGVARLGVVERGARAERCRGIGVLEPGPRHPAGDMGMPLGGHVETFGFRRAH
jgi:hypothetical protein